MKGNARPIALDGGQCASAEKFANCRVVHWEGRMGIKILTHRRWEDWCSMGLGAAILISPVIIGIVDWCVTTAEEI